MNSIDKLNSTNQQPIFFTASTLKLIVMSTFTLGLYTLHWFYKNWQAIKRSGVNCNPVIRAMFAPIFACSLFHNIQLTKSKNQLVTKFSSIILAIVFFIPISAYAPSPYKFLAFFKLVPIIYINRIAIAANNAKGVNLSNTKFTIRNWLAILFCGLCIFLIIIGDAIQDTGTPSL